MCMLFGHRLWKMQPGLGQFEMAIPAMPVGGEQRLAEWNPAPAAFHVLSADGAL